MSNNLDTLCWLLEKARALGADACDAVMLESTELNVSQRMGKPEGLERAENKGVGLRVFIGQSQGLVSSSDTGRNALEALAERAVATARVTLPDPDCTLAPPSLYPASIPDLDLFDPNEPDPQWMREECEKCEDAARSVNGITNSEGAEAHYSSSRVTLAIANGSRQFANDYQTSNFSLSVSVVAGKGTDMERDYEFTSAHHVNDIDQAAYVGLSAARRALKRLRPRKIASCSVPIVFDPRVGRGLLGTFASAISGNAIARGSSFLKDAMSQPVFSGGVTIIDNPHLPRGLASKPFDAEGVSNRPLILVQDGILRSWLLDVRTANKLKLQTTGHATRSLSSPPSPSSTNLYIEKGALSPQALIKDIKSGFFVTEAFGMGVNTVTGDYSQGAAGFWIENGEIAYPVSEVTIAGHLGDMFRTLTPANDLEFRYATNAPTLRVDAMTVAGA